MARTTVLAAGVAVLVALAAAAAVWVTNSQAAPQTVTAEIQRTFVSTSGSDANPCTAAAPCRNFAAAIANTLPGGEVVALDSGGYGAFTINKAITIAGSPGKHVAISVFSGNGIHVNPGPDDAVVLRNLYLTGLGGGTGIFFQTGSSLHVESVVVSGFLGSGLAATAADASLFVSDSRFRHSARGVRVDGALRAEIADSRADRNADQGFVFSNGARGSVVRSSATRNAVVGFEMATGSVVAVADSLADGNVFHGVLVHGVGTSVTLATAVLSNSGERGLWALNESTARIGTSTVTGNVIGLANSTGGVTESFGDNLVHGNGLNTSGTITPVGKT